MQKFNVFGMSCAACSSAVEKAVLKVNNVTKCEVNLLTGSMIVYGDFNNEEVISAVIGAGYNAELFGEANEKPKKQSEFLTLKKRLLTSLAFLLALMYFSMGYTMFNAPVPVLINNGIAIGIIELILSLIIIIINKKFFIKGYLGVIHKAPNMDTLVALGSAASFIYSVAILFVMINEQQIKVNLLLNNLYFESAAMILVLITLGKMLEAYSKGKTTSAVEGLINLSPKTATVIRDNKEIEILSSKICVDDIFIVRPGKTIPTDGVVIEGESSVDESMLTGESIPVNKEAGSNIIGGTINKFGYIKCKATKVGEETTLSQIIKLVENAASQKAPISKTADKVSGVFVPIVMGISLITFLIWTLLGKDIGFSLSRAISVLVISCPCALGLATPVAIMVGMGVGAKNNILFKTASSLEETGKINTVVFDKTGTLTIGKPVVTDIISENEDELLLFAYSLEQKSEHPLSNAIIEKGKEKNIEPLNVSSFQIKSGNGLFGVINDKKIYGGNKEFIGSVSKISVEYERKSSELSKSGKTPLFFAYDNKLLGIIAVSDVLKKESKKAIEALNKMNIKTVMLTGDNELTAKAIANECGISDVIANVLPHEKENEIKKLMKNNKVLMVGDGINDAPALTSANIGIAIGTGSDIAIESADIILTGNNLEDVSTAIKLSKATLKNIYENLFWAFFYNAICIPVAAGALYYYNITLSPMLSAFAMSLSSFCVVSNALRLNSFNKKKKKGEVKIMEKVLNVEGMMCPHCEARVKEALEVLPQVSSANPSHEKNSVTVILNEDISTEELKETIEKAGYRVVL